MHGWVGNDAGGLSNVNATRKQVKGGHGGHVGTHLCAHVTETKREKKQMVTEGHRFGITNILGMLGGLMVANMYAGADGALCTARGDTEGHGQTYSRWHTYMHNRNEKK